MFGIDPITAKIVMGILLLIIILISTFHSPSQYRELKHLYREQLIADDHVYGWKKKASLPAKILFRWITPNSEHYFNE